MTKLDSILVKLDRLEERLFVGESSLQNRVTVIEESVKNCQAIHKEENGNVIKMKLAVFSGFITAALALLVSWYKK